MASPKTSTDLEQRAEQVISRAGQSGVSLATAESCTAGALATLLANTPGAGDSFHGGFVVYSKAHKSRALGVDAALIAEHSAVSPEVAKAMARGALERSPADFAVSITGVAGPEPDEDGNPVGLVHIAVAGPGGLLLHQEHRFPDRSREEVMAATQLHALALLEDAIEKARSVRRA
jgi:nicotinamide-nucleotide amidase